MTSPQVLRFPTSDGLYVLDTDASKIGLGGVLQQWQWDELKSIFRLFVIAYGSKVIPRKHPGRNYSATERELWAVVHFVWKYRYRLHGRRFILRTDHSALQWLFNFEDLSGKIGRWVSKLNQFSMVIMYRPGKNHTNADALSRMPTQQTDEAMTQIEKYLLDRSDATMTLGEFSVLHKVWLADELEKERLAAADKPPRKRPTTKGNHRRK